MSVVAAYKRLYTQTRAGAKRRKLDFTIDYPVFIMLVTSPCEYCGYFPKKGKILRKKYPPIKYVGIDRKDNTKGYTNKNSYSCCRVCNISKHNITYTRWKNWVKRVYKGLWE